MDELNSPLGERAQGASLAHVVWSDPQWLERYPLTFENVLTYFSRSPFYDPTCNNELVRMQMHPELQGEMLYYTQREEELLLGMQGVEYVPLCSSDAHELFIIRKQVRRSADEVHVTNLYYILYGQVYEAPAFSTVLLVRLRQSADFLVRSLGLLRQWLSKKEYGEPGATGHAHEDTLLLQLLRKAQQRNRQL
jgi:mediator of RNA polymerase II transcription subunit 6